jgi:nucleotide-binding universal stress UspA family protein
MKVLVGVDGSSNSFAAVEFVGRLLSPEHDELIIFFAAPAISFEDERLDPAVEERARTTFSRAILDAALERLPSGWAQRAQLRDVVGQASTALLAAADEVGAELVAVGFRGTSSLMEHFMLGSVSRTVVHSATSPVLVVKGGSQAEGTTESAAARHLRILVAYDGTDPGESMAALLSRFHWPADTEGFVLSVVRPMFLADLPDWVTNQPRDPDVAAMAAAWEKEHAANLAGARQEAEQFRRKLPSCFASGRLLVEEGRPAEQIVAVARRHGVDLVVMGSHGGGAVKRLLLGSTSEQVLASAPCSALIVR